MRCHGMHDRKAKLRDPRPACQKLLPQDYHLRKTKLLIRYSVVSSDPAGSPIYLAPCRPPTRGAFSFTVLADLP